MSDQRRRHLQRLANQGNQLAAQELLQLRVRLGELQPEQIDLAAYAGDPIAAAVRPFVLSAEEFPPFTTLADETADESKYTQRFKLVVLSSNYGRRIRQICNTIERFYPHLVEPIIECFANEVSKETRYLEPPVFPHIQIAHRVFIQKLRVDDLAAWHVSLVDLYNNENHEELEFISRNAVLFWMRANLLINKPFGGNSPGLFDTCVTDYDYVRYAVLMARESPYSAEANRVYNELRARQEILQTLRHFLIL